MREELRDLEGQLVYVVGRIKEARPDGEFIDVLLTRPCLHRWDGNERLTGENPIHTDHLWLRVTREAMAVELLEKAVTIGRVGYYRRTDGTVDLGVSALPATGIDEIVTEVREMLHQVPRQGIGAAKKAAEDLELAVDLLRNQGKKGWAFSRFHDCDAALKVLERELAGILRTIAANEARRGTGAARGHRPRGLDLGLRNNRRTPARGVA
jgi:hypothetical protein